MREKEHLEIMNKTANLLRIFIAAILLAAVLLAGCAGSGKAASAADKAETKMPESNIAIETAGNGVDKPAGESHAETETESSIETKTESIKETASETITETKEEMGAETTEKASESVLEESDTISPEEALLLPADTVIKPSADTDAYFEILPIGDEVFARIYGNSFPTGGGITTDQLCYLRVLHVDFNGETRIGEIIVNAAAAEDTLEVFRELYDAGYQIRRMVLVDTYYDAGWPEFAHMERGNQADSVSIAYDNTSAFNYRVASNNSGMLSNHAMGRAIDLNPLENPYVYTDGSVDGPDECLAYADRSQAAAWNHMITSDDLAVSVFQSHGFSWGGYWEGDKDYQHFDYEW